MWVRIGQFLLKALGVVASGAAAYGGYVIADNLISSGSQETASSTQAISSGSAVSGIDVGALLTCIAIAGIITLVIYLIKRKK